jgi:hypothetical protein
MLRLLKVFGDGGYNGASLECIAQVYTSHDFAALTVDIGEAGHLALFDVLLDIYAEL